jgi:hypothetical protein
LRIDARQLGWIRFTAALLVAAGAAYAVYARASQPENALLAPAWAGARGPRGGTPVGAAYGVAAAALMVFAGVLGLRSKALLLRLGSMFWWTKAHVWLGLASLALALFHAGFRLGSGLAAALLVIAALVVASGILGAALQHALAGSMSSEGEATYEQIESWWRYLSLEAYREIAAACGHVEEAREALMPRFREAYARRSPPSEKPPEAQLDDELKVRRRERGLPEKPDAAGPAERGLAAFYATVVAPFLAAPRRRASLLASPASAAAVFEGMRPRVPPALARTFAEVESIAASARAKGRQAALHRALHGWLLFHVPLAMALLVLLFAHAASALYL